MTLFDHVGDLKNQEDSDQRDTSEGNQKANDAFGQGELWLGQFLVSILVNEFVVFEDLVEQIVVRLELEEKVNKISDEEDDSRST